MAPVNIHLRTENGLYICAEGGGGRELVANRAIPREWETFGFIDPNGPPLNSGDRIVIQAYGGLYICAEGGGGGEVNATRNQASTWETFTVLHADGSIGEITNGQQIALRTFNGNYICAEGGGGGAVVANRKAIGPWETFTIEILGSPPLRAEQGPDRLDVGKWMKSKVILSESGRVDTETSIWCNLKMVGFKGGAVAFFSDITGNIIANTRMRRYGVDGTWVPGKASSRTVLEVDQLDPEVFKRAVGIKIVHKLSPSDNLIKIINDGAYIAKKIGEIVDVVKKF